MVRCLCTDYGWDGYCIASVRVFIPFISGIDPCLQPECFFQSLPAGTIEIGRPKISARGPSVLCASYMHRSAEILPEIPRTYQLTHPSYAQKDVKAEEIIVTKDTMFSYHLSKTKNAAVGVRMSWSSIRRNTWSLAVDVTSSMESLESAGKSPRNFPPMASRKSQHLTSWRCGSENSMQTLKRIFLCLVRAYASYGETWGVAASTLCAPLSDGVLPSDPA
ncbi:hypothetical protein CISG_05893 [Coccidioides immitis RMSCC 3703]|uniref:Uncharacterized protein n=1 Tax=Coccidioides immitis RMSCC 3703 TaxID=454286 RepID=A0A0J8QXH9_COCIT|nr:hypothetical protein CISG_05893 [Coccidioides immitis RMSCC 3703]